MKTRQIHVVDCFFIEYLYNTLHKKSLGTNQDFSIIDWKSLTKPKNFTADKIPLRKERSIFIVYA